MQAISQLTNLTVLNISQNYHLRGGSDRMFFMTENLLRQKGHQVIPFTAAHPQNQTTNWASYFPQAADFDNPKPLDLLRFIYSQPAANAIRQLIGDVSPHIAHLHIYYGKLTSSILEPLHNMDIPIVQTLHEYKLICPVYSLLSNGQICESCQGHHFWREINKKCNRQSFARTLLSVTETYISQFLGSVEKVNHFIAVSDFVRAKMIQYGIPAEKITTIHNFVDYAHICPTDNRGKYFLYVGRLEEYKGLFTLINAASELPHIPLFIVGDGPIYQRLNAEIERKNVSHIKMLGFQSGDMLDKLIEECLCMILPSECYETFGLTILEAFVHGRPVIASEIGGIPEAVVNEVDGFLIESGNSQALREKMDWLSRNPHRAAEMGRAGREKVEKRFGPEPYYNKLINVYKSLL